MKNMREKILFNEDWLFHKGDLHYETPSTKGPIYVQSKTERMKWGPACKDYIAAADDYSYHHEFKSEKWETVTLPHDYVLLQEAKEEYNNALGFFKYENAWYRKTFILSKEDADKRLTLLFEGVATHATVYLNGCLLKHNFCGYTSFEVDITDYVKLEEENVLAVYVNTENHEGWWYEGGGIYRNVWLIKTALLSVDLWGAYIHPQKLSGTEWEVNADITLRNDWYEMKRARVEIELSAGGSSIGSVSAEAIAAARELTTVKGRILVKEPHLWDIDDPFLYTAQVSVFLENTCIDTYQTKFGFREVKVDPDKGLFLNGRSVKINGVCAHQDFGLTGKAVPDNIHRYKIQLLKEMGANGYRCSHYPHPEAVMDALDEYGFLVMAETRWFDSSEEGMQQLEMLVKRDRNHPSVIFWSTGNEEMHHVTEEGRRICKSMVAKIKSLDNTRLITAAVSNDPDQATVYKELDVIGINYNIDKYEKIKEQYPDKGIFASECCATGTTRGWYYPDCEARGFLNAYDKDTNEWFLGRARTWKFLYDRQWCLGGYQWIAFEHRGEAVWPRLCSQSGAIDLFLQKKDAFYQNQSMWIEDRPVLHLMPHWNFKGYEGRPIDVRVYCNCEETELFVNGVSFGRQALKRFEYAQWQVPYTPGELKAVGYNGGIAVIEDRVETTGRAVSLHLKLENELPCANGQDIAVITCFCRDAQGRTVPDASPLVYFATNQLGEIVGTGSDICDHTRVDLPYRKMRAGVITAAVRVKKQAGSLCVYADSENLASAVLEIPLQL